MSVHSLPHEVRDRVHKLVSSPQSIHDGDTWLLGNGYLLEYVEDRQAFDVIRDGRTLTTIKDPRNRHG